MALTPETRYAQSGETNIAYQVFGEGPLDLVVTPGFVSHLDLNWTLPSFNQFAEQLASFARVIIFDKRGTGLSDPTPGAVRFDTRIEDITAVMDGAGVERASLFGMSEGGPLSILFTATHPERVDALVLYGTFASGKQLEQGVMARFVEAVDQWGSGMTSTIFSTVRQESAVRKRLAGVFERAATSPGMARALVQSIQEVDVTSILPTIDVPCLVLHRRDDPFAPVEWGRELAKGIPGAKLAIVDGTDHMPWFGDSRPLVNAMAEFLTGRRTEGRRERRLATVLFTDIADSTIMAASMGDKRWAELLEQHNMLLTDEFKDHGGRVIKNTGDGFLVVFDSPARAIACGQAVAAGVNDLGIELRVGIHTGEIEVMGNADVGGIAVHIAARVMAEAQPGEVFVSSTVRELVVGSGIVFRPRGLHQLKGVPGDWQLYAANEVPEHLEIDLRDDRGLHTADRVSLYLAKKIPSAFRAIASIGRRED
ncbi:MAG: adenylate/guanylate cyclase domain-containing protein [Acidimicrobiia bacterium]|nr:adenylate/guanylate cyclase domain-containing protein [Acidimicrobiia bacterium]MDH3397208.1 adenylate/guanylate cyclase domain-containing protein [Acidimicrobiia bacterium]MDH5615570.1 adenylate/guanylate cyclase domain-containing protein [Acidimicrobiia bacterium]